MRHLIDTFMAESFLHLIKFRETGAMTFLLCQNIGMSVRRDIRIWHALHPFSTRGVNTFYVCLNISLSVLYQPLQSYVWIYNRDPWRLKGLNLQRLLKQANICSAIDIQRYHRSKMWHEERLLIRNKERMLKSNIEIYLILSTFSNSRLCAPKSRTFVQVPFQFLIYTFSSNFYLHNLKVLWNILFSSANSSRVLCPILISLPAEYSPVHHQTKYCFSTGTRVNILWRGGAEWLYYGANMKRSFELIQLSH